MSAQWLNSDPECHTGVVQELVKNGPTFKITNCDHEARLEECAEWRSQFVTGSEKHRNPRFLPYAFTEHGPIMLASTLNTPCAAKREVT